MIEREIAPQQARDDDELFFDHRREWSRTDFEVGGTPRPEWEALLAEMTPGGRHRVAAPRPASGVRRP